MYQALVIDLSHIDELAAAGTGDVFGETLAHEGFVGGFDDVHGVAAAGAAGGEVVDAGRAGHFVDEVLAAVAEALVDHKSANYKLIEWEG